MNLNKFTILFFCMFNISCLMSQVNCDLIIDSIANEKRIITANNASWSDYSDYDYHNSSIKTVRLTFHIIRKLDGSNNFQDDAYSEEFLRNTTMYLLNSTMATNTIMNIEPNLAPFQEDTRIRFELTNVYYWNDDYDNVYRKYYNNGYYGDYLSTKYVTNMSNVLFKDNSIHVFFCMGGGTGGHTTLGTRKWIILSDMSISDPAFTFRTIKHEMGHVMGLNHTWNTDDGCLDTPLNAGCWDTNNCNGRQLSNNVMDYNNCQCALTQCQINTMHYYLFGNVGVVSECLKDNPIIDNPLLQSNSDFLCTGNTNVSTITKLPFGVTVNWTTTSITNNLLTESVGNTFSITTNTNIKETGQIISRLNYGKLGYVDLQKDIYLNGLDDVICPSGYLIKNIVGKNIVTNIQSTKIAEGSNIILYYDDFVLLNPGFEVEQGGQFSIEKKIDECK